MARKVSSRKKTDDKETVGADSGKARRRPSKKKSSSTRGSSAGSVGSVIANHPLPQAADSSMDNSFVSFPGGGASLSSRSPSLQSYASRSTSGRQALCIGIDNYPNENDRLTGCVNDANSWASWFRGQGFNVEMLLDREATRRGIQDRIQNTIRNASVGDVIAIQFAAHGTHMPDLNGDEPDGEDEALVPCDHRTNGYIIDDDLGDICDAIADGVCVNFFMDCCHSGSNTRMLFGRNTPSGNERERFLRPDSEMVATHRRSRLGDSSRSLRSNLQREILFSACQPHETAKERNGQGDFTRYALQILAGGLGSLTNAKLISEIHRVGTFNNQSPQLWARGSFHDLPLLSCRERSLDSVGPIPNETVNQSLRDSILEIEDRLAKLRQQIG